MRKRRAPRREPASNGLPILLLLMLPLAFWIGRRTAPREEPVVETPIACLPQPCTTSTAGLCPCPAPKKPKKKIDVLPIPKKQTPAQETAEMERDPTAATARYLREHAASFSACAPKTGAQLRVHLEVQVAPAGVVEKVRITNLEPLSSDVAACVDRIANEMTPPGFDGTASEIFALTVVL